MEEIAPDATLTTPINAKTSKPRRRRKTWRERNEEIRVFMEARGGRANWFLSQTRLKMLAFFALMLRSRTIVTRDVRGRIYMKNRRDVSELD